jgi:aminoglycoside phosphotransferase family enzyme/predicted kinase
VPPLIAALMQPRRYAHAVDAVELIETHISWVLLAGEYAYKIKKPVALGFLDFSTLEARRFFCEEELRLNRRTAAKIYLEVLPIGGSADEPVLGGAGAPIEYALKMRRFEQRALFDAMARRGELDAALIEGLATMVAGFHAQLPAATAGEHGTPANIRAPALQNFAQLAQIQQPAEMTERLAALRAWTIDEADRLDAVFMQRKAAGCIRECHGDLHLGNLALIDGVPVAFDCLEFNAELRWIDVISEIAFLMMDLFDRGSDALAWGLLNAYLTETGDYAGIAVLRFYLVYRALVRAKVALLHARQLAAGTARGGEEAAFAHHVRLAETLAASRPLGLVLMHGLSASGKSRLSKALATRLGALRVRSDIERKRLAGLDKNAKSGSTPGAGLYAAASSQQTYEHLAAVAAQALQAGWPVVVDAASLHAVQRECLRRVARAHGLPFVLVSIEPPLELLRERLARRVAEGSSVSEADAGVLEHQLQTQEPLDAAERGGDRQRRRCGCGYGSGGGARRRNVGGA